MNRFWSALAGELTPYQPGEQPRVADLVKLNTNESPIGPSPHVLEAIRAAASEKLRLYPDYDATALRKTLAAYHGVKPDQVFVGNGSDEVLAHTFAALLKHEAPLLFPDVTYSFYPVLLPAVRHPPRDRAARRSDAAQRRRLSAVRAGRSSSPTRTRRPASRCLAAISLSCSPTIPTSRW